MSRLKNFLHQIRAQFPNDWYFEDIDFSFQARSVIATYDRALSTLDQESWAYLQKKALGEFCSGKNNGRGKQPFFNQLNEAFAFRFLLLNDHQQVAFIPEDIKKKNKTPDICFMRNGSFSFCEVKTLSISENEISRMASESVIDNSIYQELDNSFLETKLSSTINLAREQIMSAGTDGLVYLIVHFDDFTLAHYSTYRQQIVNVLNSKFPSQEVYIKIGLQSRKYIHHYPYLNNRGMGGNEIR